MFENYQAKAQEVADLSANILIQPVIYDESENFQSKKKLKNFDYPFSDRKKAFNDYSADVYTETETKQVD